MKDVEAGYLKDWYDRKVWKNTYWRGVRTLKHPLDLWNYQEIIYEHNIQWVIETGTLHGGSALYFAEILGGLDPSAAGGHGVVSVDNSPQFRDQKAEHPLVHYVTGDSVDSVEAVLACLPDDPVRTLLILDSDHNRDHVLRELEAYVPILEPGDYLIVEDTCVNGHPVREDYGPGPYEAVEEYLAKNSAYLLADSSRNEKFGVTQAPDGYFIRT